MQRREFLKVIGAGVASVALPAFAFDGIYRSPETVEELVAWFERNFKCSMGAPWAFVEDRPDLFKDAVEDPKFWETEDHRDYDGLTAYHTYRVQAAKQNYIVPAYYVLFCEILADHPQLRGANLYWRLDEKIQIRSRRREVPGEVVMTMEQWMDSPANVGEPEGCTNYYDENWRRPSTYVTEYIGRMRAAIPEMQKVGLECSRSYAQTGWDSVLHV